MSPQQIQQQLKTMKGKSFKYDGHVHTVKDFSIDKDSGKFNVKTDRLEFTRKFSLAPVFFESFKPFNGSPAKSEKLNGAKKTEPAPSSSILEHQPSSVIIYYSTDYSRFRYINGNRKVNKRKCKRIIDEIEEGNDLLEHYPLLCQENGEQLDIYDGQNRFYIDQQLKRPVYYTLMAAKKSMRDIAVVNSNVETWKPTNYLNLYIENGNEHYKKLDEFLRCYGFPYSTSIKLLSTGHPGSDGTDEALRSKFQKGHFKVTHENEAREHAETCKRFSAFPRWNDRGFVIAIFRIQKAGLISIDDLYAAFSKRPEMLAVQKSFKQYLWNLEQIVNVNKQKRLTII